MGNVVTREMAERVAAWEPAPGPTANGKAAGHHPPAGRTIGPRPGGADRITRARAYLAKIEPGVQGQNGSSPTYRAAQKLVNGFGLEPDEAFPLMAEYSARCTPLWTDKEIRHKLESALKKGDNKGRPRGYLLDTKDGENGRAAGVAGRGGPHGQVEPVSPEQGHDPVHLTDRGNGIRLVQRYGNGLRFCHLWNEWLAWDGKRWRVDDSAAATLFTKRMIVEEFAAAVAEVEAIRKQLEEESGRDG